MKTLITSLVPVFCAAALSAAPAQAVTVDLVPAQVKFARRLYDDISMRYAHYLYVYIRNIGDIPLTEINASIRFDGQIYNGYIYGPDDEGGSLGGTIRPGHTGKIIVSRPDGTFRHCQSAAIQIDANRQLQATTTGRNVFANDSRTVVLTEIGNPILCLRPIPIPIPPQPPRP
jgi:hypothetical protein